MTASRATPGDLFAALDALGIAHETQHHPAVFTVEESKRLRGQLPGAHVKNLFVKDKKSRLFLISALEDTRIDLKRLHETIGGSGRVSFGSADLLGEVLGVEPGSVTPFAAINDREGRVTVVLDARLMQHRRINVHPLVNTMTTGVSREDLVRFLVSTGHDPLVLAVGEAADEAAAHE
jgi:Ala-tRNA(Pro) deacylase